VDAFDEAEGKPFVVEYAAAQKVLGTQFTHQDCK
jgi:hypothetical protein